MSNAGPSVEFRKTLRIVFLDRLNRFKVCAHEHTKTGSQICHRETGRAALRTVRQAGQAHPHRMLRPVDLRRRAQIKCLGCGAIIRLGEDGYSRGPDGYRCEVCTAKAFAERARKPAQGK